VLLSTAGPRAPKGWEIDVVDRKVLLDETINAGAPWGGVVKSGQRLRIVDLNGRQAVDFLCYNLHDREERYSAPNTIKAAEAIFLTKGHALYSDLARPMLKIVEDSYGAHDTIGGCCSAPSNRMLYGVHDIPGCRENFLAALAPFGMGRRDIVPNVNWFMRVPVEPGGGTAIAPGNSPPGSYVELEAAMDVIVVVSNCPQINNPANDYNPTPIRVVVSE
jgi:urea carboxylase-associated protein 1